MQYKTLITIVLIAIVNNCYAQPKKIVEISEKASTAQLRKNLYHLASDQMAGRLFATASDTLASLFIADWFKKADLKAPYDKSSYFQEVRLEKKTVGKSELNFNGKVYNEFDGWINASAEHKPLVNVPIVFAGYGIMDSAQNDFANMDVNGKAVLLIGAMPNASNKKISARQSITNLRKVLQDKGAAAILVYRANFQESADRMKGIEPRPNYSPAFDRNKKGLSYYVISKDMADRFLGSAVTISQLDDSINNSGRPVAFDTRSTVSANFDVKYVPVRAPNVIGVIEGTDPAAGTIILSAHHDHDGVKKGVIYYGAVDNASGTVAIMEVASLMKKAKEKGFRPKKNIVFASFTGEEAGLLGSAYYAENPVHPISQTKGIINIDMLGRVDTFYSGKRADSNYAYILVRDSLNVGFRDAVYKANENVNLKLDTHYEQPQFAQRRVQGSDQYPFYLKGVQFLRIDCGFSADYHKPSDTPDKINYDLLRKQTRLVFLTLWNVANN